MQASQKPRHQSPRSEQFDVGSEGSAWGTLILWFVPSCGNQKGKQVSKITSSITKSAQNRVIASALAPPRVSCPYYL